MTDWVEVVAGEENQKYRRAALLFRTLAWMSISWAALISIWVWMGLRAGSNWWLWGTLGALFVGAVLLGIASRLDAKAVLLMPKSAAATAPNNDVRAA